MGSNIKALIENKDYDGIRKLLLHYPELANEGITIPFDYNSKLKAHPLHRICDAVFTNRITDSEAIEIAEIFLDFGANINGSEIKENEDTPLLAAASLHAEQLGIFYIHHGADIHYRGRHDGATAIHWAAYCGRDKLVERLIEEKASIDQSDSAYNSTPLGWAIQPIIKNDQNNSYHQVDCIKSLLRAGADPGKLDSTKINYLHHLAKENVELNKLLK